MTLDNFKGKIILNSCYEPSSNEYFMEHDSTLDELITAKGQFLLEQIGAKSIKKHFIPLTDENNIPNGKQLVVTVDSNLHKTIKHALEKGYTITTDKGKIFPD
jgi:hypothetical protein